MTRAGEIWTADEVGLVRRLRAEGLTWAEVAARIGRAPHATRKGFCLNAGRVWPSPVAVHAARRADLIERVEAGERVSDAARAAGVKRTSAYRALHRAGLDAEVRREYAGGS